MTNTKRQKQIIKEIKAERERQDAKFGEQNHAPIMWLAILTEEVGETAKEAVDAMLIKKKQGIVQKYADKYLYGNFEEGVNTGGRITYVRLFSIIALFIIT